jgi:hypothetical protein
MNSLTFKKVFSTLVNVVLYTFICISILGIFLTISAKKEPDGASTVFGRQIRYVLSPSMEKCDQTDVNEYEIKDIKTRSMVFIEVVPKDEAEAEAWYADLEVGDVLTFRYMYAKQETITHRITDIYKNERGGYTITLEGDNKNADSNVLSQTIDTSIKNSPNYVIGKVTGQSYLFGLFISILKSPAGIISIIILPSFVILLMEVLKIVKMINADKNKKHEEEKNQQQSELDELRRRLAELEAQKQAATPSSEGVTEASDPATDTADTDAT